ncbi:hypothetical protein CCU68_35060 [Pseudomonas gingeri NCPPB 3146 = LMG 5327]|uniref:Uncharacterized protein n=1 Tax=Pseudomonas gingeri NCPPB 3146 = LMG 5327 TaxID=707248 RepID=A0ABX4XSK3_9PSED|nr:hypothetical protein CCU68_35060 [Pseudomonas gingeri NCPPB 3146 = LMG 5327]
MAADHPLRPAVRLGAAGQPDRQDRLSLTHCGSRLAGDGARESNARLTGLIASKPAPTRLAIVPTLCVGTIGE